ncbi:hypothetical protein SAMN04488123_10720 [Natribacillus halophilus]|uniref:Uncharacterized protein n=1 Tax=Natribacillus halophilus TaxID=549003 RepID=A0A1G8NTD5_9BACI|nr:hypothetical protein SAMN04488123_10720 [Natribacillus halophilus]
MKSSKKSRPSALYRANGFAQTQVVQSYVFIEEQDFHRKEIINDDVLFRIDRLVEDTVVLSETYTKIREAKEEKNSATAEFLFLCVQRHLKSAELVRRR